MHVIGKTICEDICTLNSTSCIGFSAWHYTKLYIPSWITLTRDQAARRLQDTEYLPKTPNMR